MLYSRVDRINKKYKHIIDMNKPPWPGVTESLPAFLHNKHAYDFLPQPYQVSLELVYFKAIIQLEFEKFSGNPQLGM